MLFEGHYRLVMFPDSGGRMDPIAPHIESLSMPSINVFPHFWFALKNYLAIISFSFYFFQPHLQNSRLIKTILIHAFCGSVLAILSTQYASTSAALLRPLYRNLVYLNPPGHPAGIQATTGQL
jgi:hypothetical protein